ncbi:fibronectin type III domain-containing protein [Candidatus Thorarchaeota archaeon]|nr:MAG: fibronectin type III domain-containing protein [Candidatus Thorarchaeota archaeon]
MKSKSSISILLVILMTSSLFALATIPTTNISSQILEITQSSYRIAETPSISQPHILVYTEYTNMSVGGEYYNTMNAINTTYGTDYQLTALVNYTLLDGLLPGKDILLIPEQEFASVAKMKTVGTAWTSPLTTFVNEGGVVILLDFGNASAPGLGLHIYNESSLMKFGPVIGQYPGPEITEMHRNVFGDALCRRIEYQWTPRNNTFAVQTHDGVIAIDDYSTDNPIGVHKSMGKGHVVFLGFDMYDPDANQEQIVGNAIRFTNYVIFDDAQNTEATWEFPPPHIDGFALGAWVDDLVEDGFAVGRMDNIVNATLLNASEIFVCPLPYWTHDYGTAEIAIIDDYVANGGSVFIFSDWGSYGDESRDLVNNFGYDWARDSLWDSDDSLNQVSRIAYTGDNIINHPITTDINRVEFYAGDGFSTLPANAEKLIVTDWDGTSSWGAAGTAADGITAMAVSKYGSGKVCVVLDSNFFDGTEDADSDTVDNYFDSDNAEILMNTARWLAGGSPDNDVPLISSLAHSPTSPLNGQSVTIDVNITDADGLTNITCHYRVNDGTWTNVSMTPDGGDAYSADIGSFNEVDDVDYYIRSFDASADSMESVSSVAHFTVVNQVPSAPILDDPGLNDDDGLFNLTWSTSSDPDGFIDRYQIEMSNTSGFTHILDRWNASTTEKSLAILINGTYYFRVQSVDDHEAKSIWSNIESIEVGIPVDLTGPIIIDITHSPSNPIQGEFVTVSANVTDLHDVKNVTCYYRVNGGSWTSVNMSHATGDIYNASIGSFQVDDDVDYYILAFDNSTNYNNATSGTGSFFIENQEPTAPSLLDPGTTISISHIIVNWTAGSDHENAIDHYQLQVSISSVFATTFGEWNVTSLSFNVTDLISGTYYIRVRTIDDHDVASPWSNIQSIEVDLGPTITTTTTSPPTTTTTTGGGLLDSDILDLIVLIVTAGFVIIIVAVIISILRSKSKQQYNFD